MAQTTHFTDCILVQLTMAARDTGATALASLPSRFAQFCQQSALALRLHHVAWSAPTQTAYCYARLVTPTPLPAAVLRPMADWWAAEGAGFNTVRVSRLEQVFSAPGRSSGAIPAFHYVVEMDPGEGWMPEISRWYDE